MPGVPIGNLDLAAGVPRTLPARFPARSKARLLHSGRTHPSMQVKEAGSLTVDERSFRNPKLRVAVLISYKTVADMVGKGALFAITIFAARRLAPAAFGVFSDRKS